MSPAALRNYDAWKTATDPEPHYEPPYDANGACSNRDRCAWPGCTIVAGDRAGACELDPPDEQETP